MSDVEFVGALADFFIGIECDANVAMLDFGMLLKEFHGADDFGYAGFVVGSEQCGSVCHDEVFALVVEQFRKFLRRERDAQLGIQGYGVAVVAM